MNLGMAYCQRSGICKNMPVNVIFNRLPPGLLREVLFENLWKFLSLCSIGLSLSFGIYRRITLKHNCFLLSSIAAGLSTKQDALYIISALQYFQTTSSLIFYVCVLPNRSADIHHLERIQWLMTRFINGFFQLPHCNRLQRLDFHFFNRRCLRGELTFTHKGGMDFGIFFHDPASYATLFNFFLRD